MVYAERCARRRAVLDAAAAELVAICNRLTDVRAVYVYGSYAGATVGPWSDLDVLIVRDTTLRRMQRDEDIRRAMTVAVGCDILVVTPEEFREILPGTSMGRSILAQAKLLYAA